jgi:hypothetical protein
LFKKTMKRMALVTAVAAAGVTGLAGAASADATHVVQPGETLSQIVGSNWAAVAAGNGIANPDVIHPGDVIHLDAVASGHSAPARAAAPAAPAAPAAASTSSSSAGRTVWDQLAQCESSGNWAINTGNGYYGGLQFSQQSWQAAGGSGSPANASRAEQIRVAENLKSQQGWGAWPSCSRQLGLR